MDEFEELFGEKKPEKKVAGPEGHRARVRDAMERNPELSGFDDYELLEYLLFVTNPRKDTKPLAKELIRIFGSLSAVLYADYGELRRVPGVGDLTAHLLSNVLHIVMRAEYSRFEHPCRITTAADTARYMYARFLGRTKEVLLMTSLNINDEVIQTDEIAAGSVDSAPFDLVKLLRIADRNGAKKIILAHNHPGGTLGFSDADIESTARVIECCNLTGYTFNDHLIFVGNRYISMFAKDMMSSVIAECGKAYKAANDMAAKELSRRARMIKIGEKTALNAENDGKMAVLNMYKQVNAMPERERLKIIGDLIRSVEL